jgi:hypothetical protein
MVVSNRGNMGLRIIVFMGAATFLFLMLMAFGLKKSLQPQVGARVPEGAAGSPFNENRAWADVEYLTAPAATLDPLAASKWRQDYILGRLREAGLKTRQFAFQAAGPEGPIARTSLAGIVEGNRPGTIILCGALDWPDAEAGAANTAWLLEMARVLGGQRDGRSLWLVFLDGETGQDDRPESGAFQGSRSLVEKLRAADELTPIHAIIAINGIGDCYLNVRKETGGPAEWIEILWNTATREGYGKFFGTLPARISGSHLAFREAGIPALALVDDSPTMFSRQDAPPGGDIPPGVCRESLRAVGDVIYHALVPIEGHLDETGMRIDGQ